MLTHYKLITYFKEVGKLSLVDKNIKDTQKDECEIYCYDPIKVARLQDLLSSKSTLHLSKKFKLLADETRLKIILSLAIEGELCVCDVANIIQSSIATASYHLRFLKRSGVANYRKEGKLAFYYMDDDIFKSMVLLSFHNKES